MATDNSERIGRFLREQMTAEENEAFLHDMQTDEALRKEAQLTALMIAGLHEQQARRDADIIAEVVAAKAARRARIVRMAKWACTVAAAVLFIVGIFFYQRGSHHATDYVALADEYYSATPGPVFRSAPTEADSVLAALFRQVGGSTGMPAVVSRLQAIYDQRDAEYAYHAGGNDVRIAWHLALAYLKVEQPAKAVPLLHTIISDDKGTGLRQQAQALLSSIGEE